MLSAIDSKKQNIFWHFTYDLKVTFSGSHGISVHLAHVPASIWLFDFSDMQIPAAMVVVRQNNARILSDDIVMNAENRLSVNSHPRYLRFHNINSEMSSSKNPKDLY